VSVDSYDSIIAAKRRNTPTVGFDAPIEHGWLFPFQRHAVRWALAGGRRALFEDTGLGKSRQILAYADAVERHTGGRVIIIAPLAVGPQIAQEAAAIGLDGVAFSQSPSVSARVVVTNYDAIDKFDAVEFAGVAMDESGILKNFMGRMRQGLTDRFAPTPYKLCATATPAPNDFEELGCHSEFLGCGSRTEMLARFFVNDSSDTGTWRLKGHAVDSFWDWVASWAMCAGRPSDVGPYDDTAYILPKLHIARHIVNVDLTEGREDGSLFRAANLSATGLHGEKRRTAIPKAIRAAEIIAEEPDEPWLIWCDTDYEAEAIRAHVPGLVEVSGSMSPEMKADRLLGFAGGSVPRILTKVKIAGWGLNFQRCARMIFAGGSYSYEAFYQAVRRCWRFGQRREVVAHVVMAYTEQHLWDVVNGKGLGHDAMKEAMFAASRRAQGALPPTLGTYNPTYAGRLPAWLEITE
jgi:hypothetical protein